MNEEQPQESDKRFFGDPIPGQIWVLVGIMAAIEAILTLADLGMLGTKQWRIKAYIYGGFWNDLLTGKALPPFALQPITMFFSHALLHGGIVHLLMNSVFLISLGKYISEQAGPWPMLLLFTVSAVGGGIGFAILFPPSLPMVGASGAIFGFLGVWLYWEILFLRHGGQSLKPIAMTIFGLVGANLLLFIILRGNLAWQGHLAGFLSGLALGPIMTHFARKRQLKAASSEHKND